MNKKSGKQLIYEIFLQSAREGREEWQVMRLSRLKGEILRITKSTFSEAQFGASTFKKFLEQYLDIISIEGDHGNISARLRPQIVSKIQADLAASGQETKDASSGNASESTGDEVDVDDAETTSGLDWQTIEDAIAKRRESGDQIAVGEFLVACAAEASGEELEMLFSRAVCAWASPATFQMDVHSIGELVSRIDEFVPQNLALATVHIGRRFRAVQSPLPEGVNDLVFRISRTISDVFSLGNNKGAGALTLAVAVLDSKTQELEDAVQLFSNTTAVNAKRPSVELIKAGQKYGGIALPGERRLLRELDSLLGGVFRKFCESCEHHDSLNVARHKDELLENLSRFQRVVSSNEESFVVSAFLNRIAAHVSELIEEGVRRDEVFTRPELSVAEPRVKINLAAAVDGVCFAIRLRNTGQGTAHRISIQESQPGVGINARTIDPRNEFDLSAGTDQIVMLEISAPNINDSNVFVPIHWRCETSNGRECVFETKLELAQQQLEPNWDELERKPPYSINPVKESAHLYGRGSILSDLTLRAFAGDSTFLWGQKRVGKTSVLQVLENELRGRGVSCVFLRMGELAALHEGEIAQIISERLSENAPNKVRVPAAEHIGASIGRLIPFVNELAAANPERRFIVIIDEFDDIDPAFYTGERGRQFVKALRSLSEVGLTFFFAGSERMDRIYAEHSEDLNKWTNVALDRIESLEDCKALVQHPVAGMLEFEPAAVNLIVDYCQGNPFYMHLLCAEVFKQCWKERRTFVGDAHVDMARHTLLVKLGPTNFAHLWEDNPELDPARKREQAAENCLILTCIATLGGRYESETEVAESQRALGLSESEKLPTGAIRAALQRLRRRKVLRKSKRNSEVVEIALPIFGEWLNANAETHLLERWRTYCQSKLDREIRDEKPRHTRRINIDSFPIKEDDLLSVSSDLVYLGKQKDVAEVRVWLSQFDDDSRIEIAFALLKRLVEKGFVNDGAYVSNLAKMHEAIQARRIETGDKAWRVIRRRNDNLCIGFVDSEAKSGGAIARELAKRARPGKTGSLSELSTWINSHVDEDPILVIADDFSATGSTMVKGLNRAMADEASGFSRLVSEGRVLVCLLAAFPEAIEAIRSKHPDVRVMPMRIFSDEVRALDSDSDIFEDEGTRKFASDMLLQLGRELLPQTPMGFGDMAILVAFHNTIPNNTLPIFWSNGTVNGRPWKPLLPRA